jgi:predicted phosphodiesterase
LAVAVAVAGRTTADIGPFRCTAVARPSLHGLTTVRLAPLGSIELRTHRSPVAIELRVDELRPDDAERIAEDPTVLDDLEDEIARDARQALERLLLRAGLLSVLGGALGALASRASLRSALLGGGTGALVAAILATATAATYQPKAVAEPRYTGLLTIAPTAVGDVDALVNRFDDYRAQLTDLVGNVVTIYRAAEGLPSLALDDDATRVLHVSDIHNNPQAFDVIDQLVDQFDADVVLDTGDITDWGSEPESRLLRRVGSVGAPYVYVRGNHDSVETQRSMEARGAIVLDGDAEDVGGLRIWGIGDPRFTPDKSQPTGKDVEAQQIEAFAPELRRSLVRSGPATVDLVAVHDARAASEVGDLVPLVLAGHTHEARASTIEDATLLVEGSTGGAGLRGLQGEEPEPLACSILYFEPTTDRLLAYDRITIDGFGGTGARIERHVVADETLE